MRNYMSVYSIYDSKKEGFVDLMFAENDNVMLREFYANVLRVPESILYQFPADFELFCLADFNMNNGNAVSDVMMDDFPYSLGTVYDIMQKFEVKKNVEDEVSK